MINACYSLGRGYRGTEYFSLLLRWRWLLALLAGCGAFLQIRTTGRSPSYQSESCSGAGLSWGVQRVKPEIAIHESTSVSTNDPVVGTDHNPSAARKASASSLEMVSSRRTSIRTTTPTP